MSEFKKFKRSAIAEMREVVEQDILQFKDQNKIKVGIPSLVEKGKFLGACTVSISEADLNNGSPKIGDWIAKNPEDHFDQWLVSEEYKKNNFEP